MSEPVVCMYTATVSVLFENRIPDPDPVFPSVTPSVPPLTSS